MTITFAFEPYYSEKINNSGASYRGELKVRVRYIQES